MNSFKWHTINGHRLVLEKIRLKFSSNGAPFTKNYEVWKSLYELEPKWFRGKKGKLNYEERYKFTKFDSKQFYKELINCIEENSDTGYYRDIRILKITEGEDLYCREKVEKMIYGNI